MSPRDGDPVAAEQIAYYDARAPEYDDWWARKGRYDHGPIANARWLGDLVTIREALVAAAITGEVLELACGTGNWTEALARTATHVTAIDASPKMLALNQERLTEAGLDARVRYVRADLFSWRPDRVYDAVTLCFFLSHVPGDRLDDILGPVATALRPGGRVFVADSKHTPTTTAPDSPSPPPGGILARRKVNDGREFTIYKIFRTPDDFAAAFARHGIAFHGRETEEYFVYGFGRKQG